METNSKRHGKEIRNMTYKEKVLNVYENAHVWIMNAKGVHPKFYIQYWYDSRQYVYLSRYQKTEDAAWEEAWNRIQRLMLLKLES
jgi:tRNA U38,U39,U40 pseudouridine synthase TruA